MTPDDIELVSTRELISELMRRQTFMGIVVHAEEERKKTDWNGEKIFKVHFNSNFDPEQVCRLLEVVVEHMERNST